MTSEHDSFDLSDLAAQFANEADTVVSAFDQLKRIVGGENEAKCLQALKNQSYVIRTHVDPKSTQELRMPSELDFDIGEAAMALCALGYAEERSASTDPTVQTISITDSGKQLLAELGL